MHQNLIKKIHNCGVAALQTIPQGLKNSVDQTESEPT
jgi:hypothetical protein